jgi:hypothetical protein
MDLSCHLFCLSGFMEFRSFCYVCVFQGKYKVEVYDQVRNSYVPTPSGFGMQVEVFDPNQKLILSRVAQCFFSCTLLESWLLMIVVCSNSAIYV